MPHLGTTTRALLCDADGNLFPSEEPAFVASAAVTNGFLESLGLEIRFTGEELRLATTGKNFRTTAMDLAAAHGARERVDPGAFEEWVAEERRAVTAHLARELAPDPGVLEPLTRLAPAYTLAAVSSSATRRLDACFQATGLAELFPPDRRFSAEDSLPVPTSKPDPAIYEFALEALGLEPREALAIEDAEPGVQSAVAAGIPTVGNVVFVPPAERDARAVQLREAGAFAIVGSWADVPDVLESD